MKPIKIAAFILAVMVTAASLGLTALAADKSATVYVTIANGYLILAREPVTVTDADGDGALTISDALYAAHEAMFKGGAAAGYTAAAGDYGLYITKLWGVENNNNFGYYLNNAMAMNLTDPVKDGDSVTAYAITDTTNFSDAYSYFDVSTVSAKVGESVTLTLKKIAFDENFAPVSAPVAGASVRIGRMESEYLPGEYITDADGKVTIKFENFGEWIISATHNEFKLVPPVCVATVAETVTGTPDNGAANNGSADAETIINETPDAGATSADTGDGWAAYIAVAAISLAAIITLRRKK